MSVLTNKDGKALVIKGTAPKIDCGTSLYYGLLNDQERANSIIPLLDTSKVTSTYYMFYRCSNLTSIPLFDTSNVTNMYGMFYYCSSLTSIPLFDTSKVTNMAQMFYYCSNLTSVPALDTSKVTNMITMFNRCSNLTSIKMYGMTRSFDISPTALRHDAIVEVLNNLGTAYNSSQTLTIGSTKLALLSDDEKAIATNKGWSLA